MPWASAGATKTSAPSRGARAYKESPAEHSRHAPTAAITRHTTHPLPTNTSPPNRCRCAVRERRARANPPIRFPPARNPQAGTTRPFRVPVYAVLPPRSLFPVSYHESPSSQFRPRLHSTIDRRLALQPCRQIFEPFFERDFWLPSENFLCQRDIRKAMPDISCTILAGDLGFDMGRADCADRSLREFFN